MTSTQEIIRRHYRRIGRKGGKRRAEVLSDDRISEIAAKAGRASGRARRRKAKQRNAKQAA